MQSEKSESTLLKSTKSELNAMLTSRILEEQVSFLALVFPIKISAQCYLYTQFAMDVVFTLINILIFLIVGFLFKVNLQKAQIVEN